MCNNGKNYCIYEDRIYVLFDTLTSACEDCMLRRILNYVHYIAEKEFRMTISHTLNI